MPLSILVAEDSGTNRTVIRQMLVRLGYEPEIVSNGREALDSARERRFDIIFMDMHMPEMDGVEATRRIRAEFGSRPQPRIVALTASGLSTQRQNCLRAGMDGFLTKPLELPALLATLVRVHEGRPPSQSGTFLPRDEPGVPLEAPLSRIRPLFENEPERLVTLVDDHLSSARRHIDAMRHALAEKNLRQLEHHAHSLKSNAAMFGSVDVRELSRRIEHAAAAEGDLDYAQTLEELANAQDAATLRLRRALET